ncbi:hypothetical protein D7I39_11270 [Allopusillimonas ginsengisoli]|nr:hypothetical protein D7I39_11270 [Allopusillimonas ginsengisoli]
MAQESRLSIVIESRSAEQQAVDLEKALAALDKAGVRVSGTASKLARELHEAGKAAGRSSEEAKRATVSWQGLGTALKGLGLGLSVGGLVSMFKSVATDVEALNKMSEQIGIAIEDLGALRYAAADMAGMAEGRFDMALRRMTRRIGEAADGGGPAADALKRLKLEARELARMDAGTQFRTIADAIASMPTQADRLRVTMALFDTEGMPLVTMLQKGSGAITEMEAEARRLGVTINKVDAGRIEELNSAFERIRAQIQGVKQEAAIASLPAVELLSSGLEKLAGNFDVIAKVVGGAVAANRHACDIHGLSFMFCTV